jgi:hypothetical protein
LLLCFAATPSPAQSASKPFEFQIGAHVPLSSVRYTGEDVVARSPAVSLGVLLYSDLEYPVGFRLRADIAFSKVTSEVAALGRSTRQSEYALGIDASPRFSRVAVRGAEARFYAGTALRLVYIRSADCTVISASGGPWCSDTRLLGSAIDVVGRAGWFIRRERKASMVRLDVAYQYGRSATLQHELLIRVGLR